jgi:exosortase A
VWRKRDELAALDPAPALAPVPLAAIAVAAVAWLLGSLADVLALRQFAWITLLVAGTWMLLGTDVARRLVFPLAFLYLAVPFGEFMVPTLVEWTANFTVAALRGSGVPVLREGNVFQVPNGTWSVVEACSGVRYLIASFTVGVLYAYLTYTSWIRRTAFVVASLLVPIVANWLRAYGIVMLGYLSENRLAVGVDHLIYGWIFFGVVMLLLFAAGGLFREHASAPTAAPDAARKRAGNARNGMSGVAVLGTIVVATAVAPGVLRVFDESASGRQFDAAAPALGDWRPVAESLTDWTPEFVPPRGVIASTYAHGSERAGLYVSVYFDQNPESKLVSSENQLIRTTNRGGFMVSERSRTLDLGTQQLPVVESLLQVRGARILTRSWFWIDGTVTASPVGAKLAQARERLLGRGDAGAIIVVYALLKPGAGTSAELDDLTRQAAAAMPGILAERLRAGDAP